MQPYIIFEDYYLAVVYKPGGITTDCMRPGDNSLETWFAFYIKNKWPGHKKYYCALPHRLDKPVSGLVIIAKTPGGLKILSQQFENGSVEKIYHAWVHNAVIPSDATLKQWIKRNETGRMALVRDEENPGFKKCILQYDTIDSLNEFTLLKIRLITGRFHQIRAQLAYKNNPVAGDAVYGSTLPAKNHEIALICSQLSFYHPKTGERLSFTLESRLNIMRNWLAGKAT